MSSVRTKLFLLLSFFGATALALGLTLVSEFRELQKFQQQLDLSFQIAALVRNEERQSLTELQPQLDQATRREALASLIQNSSREKQSIFLKNELEYQRFARERIHYFGEKIAYTGALFAIIFGVGYFFLQLFLRRSVIRPMKSLSRKMTDFLNDRYTYQFSVPGNDEFGQMQSTFNQLAQRVISNMEQLRQLDSAKSEFLSIASHELRTPLTSIKGSLSLMRTGVVGPMNEMAENLLQIAEVETDRLIRLINDILDLAKIEAGKLPLHCEWNSLPDLIRTNLDSLAGFAQAGEVRLEMVNVPSVEVHMDKDRIQQVLTNLLSNAIKYSPKGQAVTVTCDINENHHLQISVRDCGKGIDPYDQELIFQKFRQATSPKNPLVKGTGLGLAIAKALVEQHDGVIGVKSVPGEGSVFYFTLPEWRFVNEQKVAVAA